MKNICKDCSYNWQVLIGKLVEKLLCLFGWDILAGRYATMLFIDYNSFTFIIRHFSCDDKVESKIRRLCIIKGKNDMIDINVQEIIHDRKFAVLDKEKEYSNIF